MTAALFMKRDECDSSMSASGARNGGGQKKRLTGKSPVRRSYEFCAMAVVVSCFQLQQH